MKIKVFFLVSMIFVSTVQATILNNLTGSEVKVKVMYVKQCLPTVTHVEDGSSKDFAELTFTIPANAKMDISGSQVKNRQSGSCYNDINNIKATMAFFDDQQNIVAEVSNIWYANPASGINIATAKVINLNYSRNNGMTLR